MPLTEKDARYVAELAHLELSADEVRKFLPQLDSILLYVEKLNQLDTTQIDPMAQVTVSASENISLRPDEVHPTFDQAIALASAPEQAAGCFKVPRVIERE
ncbi:MAG TPA: Asp-tRNA(Asn)/Glu-tRNA(Gln) amidotransferase subunit GatC [Terriglobia bacterium]|nr:Asp-tRNA(Asn)/Glu-tRNA(Gln) amidotransferase subunit GatC [Terriglobia bacterium]